MDVSKTYVDPSVFPPLADGSPSPGKLLSDRSYELGEPIGISEGNAATASKKTNSPRH
jgi:hypothetical protein